MTSESVAMEPLRAFVSHEVDVLDASPSFNPTDDAATGTTTNDFNQISNTAVNSKSSVGTQTNPLFSSTCHDTRSGESEPNQETKIFLRTKYNIQVELNQNATHVLNISLRPTRRRTISDGQEDRIDSSPAIREEQSNKPISTATNTQQPGRKHRYRLFPDWQTSYLWYDISWPGNPKDDPFVELDEIEQRYPTLFPFYLSWLESHESELDRLFSENEIDIDSPSDHYHLVAWEINGFLMSCWLAFQTDVHSVEFTPSSIKYEIKPGTMELELQRYLEHKSDELQRMYSAE